MMYCTCADIYTSGISPPLVSNFTSKMGEIPISAKEFSGWKNTVTSNLMLHIIKPMTELVQNQNAHTHIHVLPHGDDIYRFFSFFKKMICNNPDLFSELHYQFHIINCYIT